MAYAPPQDRVRETSTTTGAGDIALSATSDYRRFASLKRLDGSAIQNGDLVDYAIILGGAFEVGICPWNGNALIRSSGSTIVTASSNGGALVAFGAGVKDVFSTMSAQAFNAALRTDIDQMLPEARKAQGLANLGALPLIVAKTANFTVAVSERGKLLSANPALNSTITAALPPAATVGAGFGVMIENTAFGSLVVDPDGSETIDGYATINAFKGQLPFWVISDGANWRTVGRQLEFVIQSGPVGSVAFVDLTIPDGLNDVTVKIAAFRPANNLGYLGLRMGTNGVVYTGSTYDRGGAYNATAHVQNSATSWQISGQGNPNGFPMTGFISIDRSLSTTAQFVTHFGVPYDAGQAAARLNNYTGSVSGLTGLANLIRLFDVSGGNIKEIINLSFKGVSPR